MNKDCNPISNDKPKKSEKRTNEIEVSSTPRHTPLLRIRIDGANHIREIPLHFIGEHGEIFRNLLGNPFWITTPVYDVKDTVYEAVLKRKI